MAGGQAMFITIAIASAVLLLSDKLGRILPQFQSRPPVTADPWRPALDESLLALELANDTDHCPPHSYKIRIFSKAPLVMYIENFLAPEERSHLLDISEPLYQPASTTGDGGATVQHDPSVRRSETALIPRTPVVRCIEARARALQGWRGDLYLERLRTQRYRAGGHYREHFDWNPSVGGGTSWGRVSSFMVWVAAESVNNSEDPPRPGPLEGGGTEFRYLHRPSDDGRWARFVEERTDEGQEQQRPPGGVIFKPVPGNAIYWENYIPGSDIGHEDTLHAGLPVVSGVKVGLNIWSWGRLI